MEYDFENKRRLTTREQSELSEKDFWEYQKLEALEDIRLSEEKIKLAERHLQ